MAEINLDDYSYELPEELIAQKAARPRDSARLMAVMGGCIEHCRFSDIAGFLKRGDVLVLNSTKVSKAKIAGKKESGAEAEVVLEKKVSGLEWECKIKCRRPRKGTRIFFEHGSGEIVGRSGESFVIRLSSKGILKKAFLPGPPYIKRRLGNEYQTVYADKEGSLAAPTAGLHFTKRLIKKIEAKGVKVAYVTLHVSYGTFKSIDYGVENYVMEPEFFSVSEDAARAINERKGRLVAVGTTVLKALESSCRDDKVVSGQGFSELFIYPPYEFKSGCDVLVTNFHLPKSTLMLMVCAFAGRERVLRAYKEAIEKKYRFYSLGDAMVVER